jgi:hypothetical protein
MAQADAVQGIAVHELLDCFQLTIQSPAGHAG